MGIAVRRSGVGADPQRDGIAAEPPSGAGREERVVGVSGSFAEPEPQERLGGAGERDGSLFSAFAFAADAGAGSECDVAAVQADEFGDSKPAWMANNIRAPSRRPSQRACSGAASSASTSAAVRNVTSRLPNRFGGIASPRWMSGPRS